MNDMEIEYISDVLQGKQPSIINVDWYQIYGFLELNRISGYFYHRIMENRIEVPKRIESKLRERTNHQALRNQLMAEWIAKIGEALEGEQISYAFLKGSVLSNSNFNSEGEGAFYGKGERVSNDIDLLVAPKAIGKVEKTLFEMGFQQGYFGRGAVKIMTRREILERRMNRGETVPFQFLTEHAELPHVEVDINFSLDYLPNGTEYVLNQMLSRTKLYSANGNKKIRSLEPIDFLIHLILHQYKEMRVYSMVMRGKDTDLYKLLDLYLMMKIVNQDDLITRVREYGVENEAAVVLKTMYSFFGSSNCSDDISEWIENVPQEAERVIDPVNGNREYVWTVEVTERMKRFDHTGMLVGI